MSTMAVEALNIPWFCHL